MTDPNIKTKIVHSLTNDAYNVIGETLGGKFKIARCPYVTHETENVFDRMEVDAYDWLTQRNKNEARNHAEFISYCFNNSKQILST